MRYVQREIRIQQISCNDVSDSYVLNADSGRWADELSSWTGWCRVVKATQVPAMTLPKFELLLEAEIWERDLSMLMAMRWSIEAVQHMTSSATHMSHRASPSCHSALFTWTTHAHTHTHTHGSRDSQTDGFRYCKFGDSARVLTSADRVGLGLGWVGLGWIGSGNYSFFMGRVGFGWDSTNEIFRCKLLAWTVTFLLSWIIVFLNGIWIVCDVFM